MAHERLIKENVAPQGAAAIGVVQNGTVIGQIPLGTLAHSYGAKLFSFGLMSDVHINNGSGDYTAASQGRFEKALTFCQNQGVRFVAINGDVVVEQLKSEYAKYKEIIDKFSFPIYSTSGNHDMGRNFDYGTADGVEKSNMNSTNYVCTDANWAAYTANANNPLQTNLKLSFSITEDNKTFYFAFLPYKYYQKYPTYTQLAYTSDDISWLRGKMHSDGINFVFVHMPFADRAGNFGYYYSPERILRSSNASALKSIATDFPNSIFFCGHTHDAWELQGKSKIDTDNRNTLSTAGEIDSTKDANNYDANIFPCNGATRNAAWHTHIPSLYNARYYERLGESSEDHYSQFAIVDVYADCAIVKGCGFDNSNASSVVKFIPIAQYKLSFDSASSGGSTTTSSYIYETNKIIYGFVGETLDLGWTPEQYRRQDYSIFGASTTDTSVDNRISMSGSKMSFISTANKNWKYSICETVDGLSSSSNETGCWFWTYKSTSSNIKYKTIIAS